jgi:hypothetical protein
MIGLPPVELAAIFDLSATTLAAFAVFAGLYLAIIGSSDPKVAKVPGAALFLVLFGTPPSSYLGGPSNIISLDTEGAFATPFRSRAPGSGEAS